MSKVLTAGDARSAVYFDFECTPGRAPSVLGWSFLDDDGNEWFQQQVVEPALWPAAGVKIPQTGGSDRCSACTLNGAVSRLFELAEGRDRLLVSWSQFDTQTIALHVDDPSLVERVASRHRNAIPTARRWLNRLHPGIELQKDWGGKYKLAVLADIMGIHVPQKFGQGVAAHGIKQMRRALERVSCYGEASKEARVAWKAMLGHNRLDCLVAGAVVRRASQELANANAGE